MNYIEQIRGFWRSHEEHSFGPTEVALYFYLVEVCNICRWKNPFKRNNAKIGADLGISFNTLKNARNKLRQSGLIDFETRNGSSNVSYTLSKFDEVTNEVSAEVDVEVTNEVDVEVLPTKDKLNKTKQNSTKKKEKKEELTFPFNSNEFVQKWSVLLSLPKWKKKIPHALQISLNKLGTFEEEFALLLIDEAIEKNWQGVVFDGTKEKYAKWKQQKGGKHEEIGGHSRSGSGASQEEFAQHIARKLGY